MDGVSVGVLSGVSVGVMDVQSKRLVAQVMRRQDQQAVMDNYSKRIGRVGGLPTPFPSAARPPQPIPVASPTTSSPGPYAPTPDLVSRFRRAWDPLCPLLQSSVNAPAA